MNCLADAGISNPDEDCGETDEGVEAVGQSNLCVNGGEKEVLCRQILEVLGLSARFVFASSRLYIIIVIVLF